MKSTKRVWRLLVLLACVSLLLSFPALARAQDRESQEDAGSFQRELEQTSQLIVMVTVERSGAGIIFGREKDRLLIATAYHFLHRGDEHPPVRVELKSMPNKLLNATLLKYDAAADLAVLSVEKQGINVCSLPFDRLGNAAKLGRKDAVSAVGNPNGVHWAMPVDPDKISEITPKEIVFQSNFISEGHSGGALLNEKAALVGMILADQPPFGRAMNIDVVLRQMKQWGYPVQLYPASEFGKTPLHEAAGNGDVVAIRNLLVDCGDPNARDDSDETPLHYAAFSGSTEAMLLLLKAGADLNAAGGNGYTPLHEAADEKQLEAVRFLLRAGARVNARAAYGVTPIHLALTGPIEIMRILIAAGADVNAVNDFKETPLHVLAKEGHRTPALKLRWLEAMRFLVGAGAKIEIRPLIRLIGENEVEAVTVLIRAVSDLNAKVPDQRNGGGDGPLLHEAAHNKQLEIVERLLKTGADPNSLDFNDETALFVALRSSTPAIQDLLIAHGGRIQSTDESRLERELAAAVANNRVALVKLLLAAGANPNKTQTAGLNSWTLLHHAIENGNLEIVKALVKAGADINAKPLNETPLEMARRMGLAAFEKVLLEGADTPSRPTSQTLTPKESARPSAPSAPSSRFRSYTNRNQFSLTVPENWSELPSEYDSMMFSPEGGHVKLEGNVEITRGVMTGVMPTQSQDLKGASEGCVTTLLQANSHLRQQGGYKPGHIGGYSGLSTTLAGKSNTTGRIEQATVYMALLRNGKLFYLITIAPQDEYSIYQKTFQTILQSVQINN